MAALTPQLYISLVKSVQPNHAEKQGTLPCESVPSERAGGASRSAEGNHRRGAPPNPARHPWQPCCYPPKCPSQRSASSFPMLTHPEFHALTEGHLHLLSMHDRAFVPE